MRLLISSLLCLALSGLAACDRASGEGCPDGHQDNDDNGRCEPNCATADLDCGTYGDCSDLSGTARCDCLPGWTGEGCTDCAQGYHLENGICSVDVACPLNPCSGHGTCDDSSGVPVCQCDQGYVGDDCDRCDVGYQDNSPDDACLPDCDTAGLECTGQGECSDADGVARCVCDSGYQDNDENNSCLPDCPTADLGCDANGGDCSDLSGVALCLCDPGYDGDRCEVCAEGYHQDSLSLLCVSNISCTADQCGAHGQCDDQSGVPECICDQGWTGNLCDGCDMGYLEEGSLCVQNVPVSIAAGDDHTCLVLYDGTARCWGSNWMGALGDGLSNTDAHPHPQVVDTLVGAVQIGAGFRHSCARTAAGQAWCWGRGYSGELGNGSFDDESYAGAVYTLTQVEGVFAGHKHNCALLADNTIWCWGDNGFGQLGDGSFGNTVNLPQLVPGLNDLSLVAPGVEHTCAADSSGEVWCWGANDNGQLGDGTLVQKTFPESVVGLGGELVLDLSAGDGYGCAVLSGGTAMCWGDGQFGQLGDGVVDHQQQCASSDCSPTPVAVSGLTDVAAISCGYEHACALLGDGTVWCWGANSKGQLGNSSFVDSNIPVQVVGLSDASQVSAGKRHSCALTLSGQAWCWGHNYLGKLGDGSMSHQDCSSEDCSYLPVQVVGLP